MFMINLNYLAPLAQIDQHLASHRQWLDSVYAQGIFICSGPLNPRTGGLIIAAKITRPQLEKLLQEDPFAIHGLASYQITEFSAVKVHPNLQTYCEA